MDQRAAKHEAYRIAADLVARALDTGEWDEWVDDAVRAGKYWDDADTDRIELGLMEIEASLRRRSAPRSRGVTDQLVDEINQQLDAASRRQRGEAC